MNLRRAIAGLAALLPSALHVLTLRYVLGYRIGRGVRIGFSVIDAANCDIDDGVIIGHLNIISTHSLKMGPASKIGMLNILRGGSEVILGAHSQIVRQNEINAIRNPVVAGTVDQRFSLGLGAVITAGHKIDFTDRVDIGENVVVGGRNSSIWTHNRQFTAPIRIGRQSYLGSDLRMAPGASIPARCIVGMGAVVTGPIEEPFSLIAGVPARVLRPLTDADLPLLEHPTYGVGATV